MSAYLSSSDTISALVTYWADASNRGCSNAADSMVRCFAMAERMRNGNSGWFFDWASREAPKKIKEAGSVERLAFELLTAENVASLQSCYSDSPEMWEESSSYVFSRSSQVMRWLHYAPLGHGNLVGMVRGYAYQSCEHDGWESSVAFQICEQIKSLLLGDLESRDCKGENHWASFVEPKNSEPKAISLSALCF